ncbi:MAG: hypothetical protein AAGJ54_11935 [Planctomycetota bacterium]
MSVGTVILIIVNVLLGLALLACVGYFAAIGLHVVWGLISGKGKESPEEREAATEEFVEAWANAESLVGKMSIPDAIEIVARGAGRPAPSYSAGLTAAESLQLLRDWMKDGFFPVPEDAAELLSSQEPDQRGLIPLARGEFNCWYAEPYTGRVFTGDADDLREHMTEYASVWHALAFEHLMHED